jgi:putative transposase
MRVSFSIPTTKPFNHCDRGSQDVHIRYSELLVEAGIEPSVGSVGGSYDNALTEPINGLYKAQGLSIAGDHGATSKPWSSPHSNGSTGSTTAAFWSPREHSASRAQDRYYAMLDAPAMAA